jgi:hypothetical protein
MPRWVPSGSIQYVYELLHASRIRHPSYLARTVKDGMGRFREAAACVERWADHNNSNLWSHKGSAAVVSGKHTGLALDMQPTTSTILCEYVGKLVQLGAY